MIDTRTNVDWGVNKVTQFIMEKMGVNNLTDENMPIFRKYLNKYKNNFNNAFFNKFKNAGSAVSRAGGYTAQGIKKYYSKTKPNRYGTGRSR